MGPCALAWAYLGLTNNNLGRIFHVQRTIGDIRKAVVNARRHTIASYGLGELLGILHITDGLVSSPLGGIAGYFLDGYIYTMLSQLIWLSPPASERKAADHRSRPWT